MSLGPRLHQRACCSDIAVSCVMALLLCCAWLVSASQLQLPVLSRATAWGRVVRNCHAARS
eukprot:12147705-Alexandrium_andersonii.AAC.1